MFGWLGDLFRIPEMVRDANNDPEYVENFKKDIRQRRRPPFAFGQLCGSVMVAYLWGQVSIIAIPETSFNDINWSFLHGLVPIVVALGVWTSGNCGRQQGNIWPCLIAAYAAYPLRFIPELDKFWLYAVVIVSSLAFDKWSKQWRLTTPTKRSLVRRIGTLYVCGLMYLSFFGSYCYFNAKITNADGDVVHVHEAISSAMNSPWWSEFKQSLGETYAHLQHRGYYETYKMIIDQLDTDGEQKALEVIIFCDQCDTVPNDLAHSGSRPEGYRNTRRNNGNIPATIERASSGQGERQR